jgi:hypothetical protein
MRKHYYKILRGVIMAAKKAFGGYTICFAGRKETLEDVFGKGKITPSEMTKKLWVVVKSKRLAGR